MPVPQQAWEAPSERERLLHSQVRRTSLQQSQPTKQKKLLTIDIGWSETGLSIEKAKKSIWDHQLPAAVLRGSVASLVEGFGKGK